MLPHLTKESPTILFTTSPRVALLLGRNYRALCRIPLYFRDNPVRSQELARYAARTLRSRGGGNFIKLSLGRLRISIRGLVHWNESVLHYLIAHPFWWKMFWAILILRIMLCSSARTYGMSRIRVLFLKHNCNCTVPDKTSYNTELRLTSCCVPMRALIATTCIPKKSLRKFTFYYDIY